ncbi:hypothetical protein ACGVWS_04360 [Enterobacteriaceae bacterium LUAb1]
MAAMNFGAMNKAITSALKESGITEEKLEAARAKIHALNESVELYKNDR